MNVTLNLQKWGNSNGVRLPKKVIEAVRLSPNQAVSVSIQDGSIVLTPIFRNDDFTLESMLKGVTPELVGGEYSWGGDVGLERIDG